MYQVIYSSKLENKCTLTPLDPRLLCVGPKQAKGHLSFRGTCLDLYSYLSGLCVLCLAACSAAGHLSVLYSARQLPICTMQFWAASKENYSAFHIEYIVFFIIFQ